MSYIYAWKLFGQPFYKIGHSSNPDERMADYCRRHRLTPEPNSLRSWRVLTNDPAEVELHVHKELARFRAVMVGGPQELFFMPDGVNAIEKAVDKVVESLFLQSVQALLREAEELQQLKQQVAILNRQHKQDDLELERRILARPINEPSFLGALFQRKEIRLQAELREKAQASRLKLEAVRNRLAQYSGLEERLYGKLVEIFRLTERDLADRIRHDTSIDRLLSLASNRYNVNRPWYRSEYFGNIPWVIALLRAAVEKRGRSLAEGRNQPRMMEINVSVQIGLDYLGALEVLCEIHEGTRRYVHSLCLSRDGAVSCDAAPAPICWHVPPERFNQLSRILQAQGFLTMGGNYNTVDDAGSHHIRVRYEHEISIEGIYSDCSFGRHAESTVGDTLFLLRSAVLFFSDAYQHLGHLEDFPLSDFYPLHNAVCMGRDDFVTNLLGCGLDIMCSSAAFRTELVDFLPELSPASGSVDE